MPRILAAAFCVALLGTATPLRADTPAPRICPGLKADLIEQQVPSEVRRFAFEGSMLKPFMELWSNGRRPVMRTPPERVTVWAVPKYPYLVGFQRADCIIAFLKVERRKLWQALRVRVGWPA